MLNLNHIEFAPAPLSASFVVPYPRHKPRIAESAARRADESAHAIDPETWALLGSLFHSFSLDVHTYRAAALERRLPALRRRLHVDSVSAARPILQRSARMRLEALECLLLGVTDFFRDTAVFDHLRQVSLPALLESRPALRVLSAGTSDGRELYSLAMLLAEANVLHRCTLLGLDCRPEAIQQAQAAVFARETLAKMDPALCARWFVPAGSRVRLRPELARAARFQLADLLTFKLGEPWDLILCRNLIMYFDPAAAGRAWQRLAAHLTPGGLLVTGKAEQPPAGLPLVRLAPCVYRKTTRSMKGQRTEV